jgi:hypothetical protein
LPWEGVKGSNKCLLKRIEYRTVVTHAITHCIDRLWKPNFVKTSSKNRQSTGLIHCKRIYNFLCSILVLHQLLYVLFTLPGVFMHFLELTY